MKNIILVVALSFLSSCAKYYIKEWHGDEVTACGNNNTNRETIERIAAEKCGSPVKVIGGGQTNAGQAYVGYGMFQNINDECLVFHCERGPASAPTPASK